MMSRLGKIRRENIKKRKNFFPTLLLSIISWLILATIILFLPPGSPLIICTFFLSVIVALFLTTSIILGDTKKGTIITLSLSLFLILRYFGIGNVLNFIFIAGLSIAIYTLAK